MIVDDVESAIRTDPQLPTQELSPGLLHDGPAPLPAARGPVSAALLGAVLRDPGRSLDLRHLHWDGEAAYACTDEDLQLALWIAYELHHRGLAGVDERWEWHPELLWARARWEDQLVAGLELAVPRDGRGPDPAAHLVRTLTAQAEAAAGPSLSTYVLRQADAAQFRELLVHRSLYVLREADAHSWAVPRLSGAVKGALVTLQTAEHGGGVAADLRARQLGVLLAGWGLDTTYAHHLDRVPGTTLLGSNLISLFGLHRRWRGALVGHLTASALTSSVTNARLARAHRRLGGSEEAAAYFDGHVAHEQTALHDLAAGLVRTEPTLARDVLFGARCAAYADTLLTHHLLARWRSGSTSLLPAAAEVPG